MSEILDKNHHCTCNIWTITHDNSVYLFQTTAAAKTVPKVEAEKDNSDSEKQENQNTAVFDELGG